MRSRRFSQLPLYGHETRAGAFVRAAAILSIMHFLSVSRRSEAAATQSYSRSSTAKDGEKTAAGPDAPTGGRTSHCAHPRAKEPICTIVDASARCCHNGIVLQQRLA